MTLAQPQPAELARERKALRLLRPVIWNTRRDAGVRVQRLT
jgi:hypothetical protein